MAEARLPSGLEAAAIIRRAEVDGNFATVVRKGDPDRGAILLIVSRRGAHFGCLERVLSIDGEYRWQRAGPDDSAGSAELADFLARRARFDDDLWVIELDIADPERFIAETTASG